MELLAGEVPEVENDAEESGLQQLLHVVAFEPPWTQGAFQWAGKNQTTLKLLLHKAWERALEVADEGPGNDPYLR